MEASHRTIRRLLAAVETLTHEEEHLFNTGFYVESAAVQKRAMPLVTKIAGLLVGPGVARSLEPEVQERIQKLIQARDTHYELVTARLKETREQLQKISTAAVRVRQVKPVYGDSPRAGSVVSVAG